jgi:uncharacterized protein (TIGR02391 family)
MFERFRDLQRAINRIGLGGSLKMLPSPRMLAIEDASDSGNDIHDRYLEVITDVDLLDVSRDLFVSGFYSEAVGEAYKFVDNFVKAKSGSTLSGSSLMEWAFSPKNPTLKLNKLSSESEQNEQAGYHRIFAGSMLGIRNPTAHENGWISDPEVALEAIVMSQHLLRKARNASL